MCGAIWHATHAICMCVVLLKYSTVQYFKEGSAGKPRVFNGLTDHTDINQREIYIVGSSSVA